jgi:hypothetical protein
MMRGKLYLAAAIIGLTGLLVGAFQCGSTPAPG